MILTFWGVRGSMPVTSSHYQHVGGDTSCVTLQVEKKLIIFDSGTGIYSLGEWMQGQEFESVHLFYSHFHYDHVIGLPFFSPLWKKDFSLYIYGASDSKGMSIKEFMTKHLFHPPFFPVRFDAIPATLYLQDVTCGVPIFMGELIKIESMALNHPGGSMGYAVSFNGKKMCYITDHEHRHGPHDPNHALIDFVKEADMVVYDATYSDEEFLFKKGWGHSTWQEGVRLCQGANIKKLFLYHHDHSHDDKMLEEIERKAQTLCSRVCLARQGMRFDLS